MTETDNSPVLTAVRAALERVVDPCSIATGAPLSLAQMGLLKSVVHGEAPGEIVVTLRVTSPFCTQVGLIQERVVEVTSDLPGVHALTLTIDDGMEWDPTMIDGEARARLRAIRPTSHNSITEEIDQISLGVFEPVSQVRPGGPS